MKKYLLLPILLIHAFWLFGYDYQTVYSHRVLYFSNENGNIETMLMDSVKVQDSDSIIYSMKNFQHDFSGCYKIRGTAWIGSKIIINKNWNYFIVGGNDTVKLNTSAALNDEFVFYKNSSMTINATLVKWDTLHVLGSVDSVKTFRLKTYDISMNPHPIDGKEIQISKKQGILNSVNIFLVPKYKLIENGQILASKSYSLKGMENPAKGIRNFTWKEANDFQPGDEFHYTDLQNHLFGGGSYIFKKIIKKILSRKSVNDTIYYDVSYDEERKYIPEPKAEPQYSYQKYKRVEKYFTDKNFDGYPGVPYYSDGGYYIIQMGSDNTKSLHPKYFFKTNDSIACEPVDDTCVWTKVEKGLGLTMSSSGCWQTSQDEYDLVYYRKGNKTWGTPLTLIDHNYVPFPTNNATWSQSLRGYTDEPILLSYNLQGGDTIINNKTYKKIHQNIGTNENPVYVFKGGMREENKKIFYIGYENEIMPYGSAKQKIPGIADCYYISSFNNNEGLLYDFNAQEGEWVESMYTYYLIEAIDSVKIDNKFRRRYKTTVGDIIEGIGNIKYGLLNAEPKIPTCGGGGIYIDLICFSENGKTLYKNPEFVDCNSTQLWNEKKYFEGKPMWTEWQESMFGCNYTPMTQYFISGDTIINDMVYKKFYERSIRLNETFELAVREENGRVYVNHPFFEQQYGESDKLLYDYTLNVGDTLRVTYLYPYEKKPVITSVEVIELLNGEKRRLFKTDIGFEYVEGIGSPGGFFRSFFPITTCGISEGLKCFAENGVELWRDPNKCKTTNGQCCGDFTGLNSYPIYQSSISPNPTKDKLFITLSSGVYVNVNIKILDGLGKIVDSKDFENTDNLNISLENHSSGIYFVQIRFGDKTETHKVIKM